MISDIYISGLSDLFISVQKAKYMYRYNDFIPTSYNTPLDPPLAKLILVMPITAVHVLTYHSNLLKVKINVDIM